MHSGLWFSFGIVTAATLVAFWFTRPAREAVIWLVDGRGTREAARARR